MKREKLIRYRPVWWPIIVGYGRVPSTAEYHDWQRRAAKGDKTAKRHIDEYHAAQRSAVFGQQEVEQ